MEELFNIIGKLYVELYNMQKYIETLQKSIQDKDKKISELLSGKEINEW